MKLKKLYKKPISHEQEIFCLEYVKTGQSLEAFEIAFPERKNISKGAKACQISRLLNNENVKKRIQDLQQKKENALINSVSISKRKLLETALQMLEETTENGKAERGHAINLLKLLMQKEGLINNNQNQTQINLQVNNNTLVNDISKFLDI